jgi:hypothetical protein
MFLKAGAAVFLVVGMVALSSHAFALPSTAQESGQGSTAGDAGHGVSVGVTTTATSPGTSGATTPGRGGGVSGPVCTYTPVTLSASGGFGLPAGGPTPGWWYIVQCAGPSAPGEQVVWVPTNPGTPAAPAGVEVSPSVVAAEAAASIVLPSPVIQLNPAAFSVVNFATWLSVGAGAWHPFQATAAVGGVTATATAIPESVEWTMGDGGSIDCAGPGTPYNPAVQADLQSTACSYAYTRSSDGEPSTDGNPDDGAFNVTATVTWKVTWTTVGVAGGGTLPPLETSATIPVRVEQVESVGTVQ